MNQSKILIASFYKKGRKIEMIDYSKLYNNVPDEFWKLFLIYLLIGIGIFVISYFIFEKLFEGYKGSNIKIIRNIVKFNTAIKDKDEYVNRILNKFYVDGKDVTLNEKELMKKLKK